MNINEFIPKCKELVVDYVNHISLSSDEPMKPEDVYVVWQCKTLQNAKALLSTPGTSDGLYFEATLNGDKSEIYLDAYKKQHNIKVEV